jgi:hypothetical protein
MHRITFWSALALSAIGLVVCYMVNASGLTYNPAVPTDNSKEQGNYMQRPDSEKK